MSARHPSHAGRAAFRFAGFVYDREQDTLTRGNVEVAAEPKVRAVIRHLLEHHGRTVSKDELLATVWPDTATTLSSLTRAVSLARTALADPERAPSLDIIETVRGKGYRISAPLTFAEADLPVSDEGHFVGRRHEIERIEAVFDSLEDRRGNLIMVDGDAGIGKTRLAQQVALEAGSRGIEVLWGRSREDGGGPAYGPWTEIMRTHAGRLGIERMRHEAGIDLEALSDLLPELSPARLEAAAPPTSAAARSLQVAALERLLHRAVEFRSLLLVVEDIHIADDASHYLFQRLAEMVTEQSIVILATYRGAEVSHSSAIGETILRWARIAPNRCEVQLRGFTREETHEFVRECTDRDLSDADVDQLHQRCDGGPLFLQEMIRHQATASDRQLPETLRLLMRFRTADLEHHAHRALSLASVIGREFRPVDLAHALEKNESDVVSWLGEAEGRRLIEASGRPGNEFRFTHALIREALYDELRSDEKRELHGRVGKTIEALYGSTDYPPLDDLARHFAEAGFGDRAIRYSVAAGKQARAHLAFERAVSSFRRALRVLASMPPLDQAHECRLLLELGDVLHRTGKSDEAMESVRRAIDVARHIGDSETFARGACTLALWRDDNIGIVPIERIALLEEALELLPRKDSAVRARTLTGLSADLYWSDEFERSAALSREAVEVARRVGDPAAKFVALYQRYDMLFGPEHGDQIEEINAEVLALARELNDPEYEFLAYGRIYERNLTIAKPSRVDRALDQCAKIADRLRQPSYNETVETMRAARDLWQGNLSASTARLPEAREAALDDNAAIASIALIPHLFLVLRMRGRLDDLEPIARAGVEMFPGLYALRCALALFCALTDRRDEAQALLAELARDDFADLRRDVNHAINLAVLAETVARVDDRELARSLIPQVQPYAGCHMITGVYMSLGAADRYLGLLATTMRDFDTATRHFDDAHRIEKRMRARPWLMWGERDHARMLMLRDSGVDGREARERLERADRIEQAILSS